MDDRRALLVDRARRPLLEPRLDVRLQVSVADPVGRGVCLRSQLLLEVPEVHALGVRGRTGLVPLSAEVLVDKRRERRHPPTAPGRLLEGTAAEDEVTGVDAGRDL